MKLTKLFIAIATTSLLATSCKDKPNADDAVKDEATRFEIEDESGTKILSARELNDTITVDGHLYHYHCALHNVDSIYLATNPQGDRYLENVVDIEVRRDSTVVYKKSFFKDELQKYLPANEQKNLNLYTMVGVNYNVDRIAAKNSALYFIVSVGDPDIASENAFPLELCVKPDGSSTITKATNLNTESQHPDLNVDPPTDE